MVSVAQNGNLLAPNASGVYPVVAEASDWIEIVSRRNPVDVTVNFSFEGDGDISWLKWHGQRTGNFTDLSDDSEVLFHNHNICERGIYS